MKQISNITGIVLIVMAFCSCGKTQKEIEREKSRHEMDSIITSFPMYTPIPTIPYPYSKTIFLTHGQFLNYKFRTGDWATIEPIDIDYKRSKVLKMELHSYTPFPEQQIILTSVPKKTKP